MHRQLAHKTIAELERQLRRGRVGARSAARDLACRAFLGDEAALQILLQQAAAPRGRKAKAASICALGLMGARGAQAAALVQGCLTSRHKEIVLEAVQALGKMKVRDDSVVAAFWSLRDHPDDAIQARAMRLGFEISGNQQFEEASRNKARGFNQDEYPFDHPIYNAHVVPDDDRTTLIVIGGLFGRSPMVPPAALLTPPVQKRLLLRKSPANDGLVIATEERARFVDQIHRAIESSRTWREFKDALPEGEYEPLVETVAENDGEAPALDDPFTCTQVPGWEAGDYPPWLQAEMDEVVPLDLLEAFGTRENTFLNGPYFEILPSKRDEFVAALRARGFEVEVDSELYFW